MNLPDPNASSFREGLAEPLEELREAWEITGESGQPGETTPALLVETFQHLYEAMQRTEASILANMKAGSSGNQATPNDVSELGEYALEMFEQAGHWLHHDQFDRFMTVLREFL